MLISSSPGRTRFASNRPASTPPAPSPRAPPIAHNTNPPTIINAKTQGTTQDLSSQPTTPSPLPSSSTLPRTSTSSPSSPLPPPLAIVGTSATTLGDNITKTNGIKTTSPPVTNRFSGLSSVSVNGIPPSPNLANSSAPSTRAAPSRVVTVSGAEPLNPPCHTAIPAYPPATTNGPCTANPRARIRRTTSLANNAPTINPSPQFTSPARQATSPTNPAADPVEPGIHASLPITRRTGPLEATACPVTRIKHICIPNARNRHNPSEPRHVSSNRTTRPPTDNPDPENPNTTASTAVRTVNKTASTNGSGAVRRNTPLIQAPNREIIRAA